MTYGTFIDGRIYYGGKGRSYNQENVGSFDSYHSKSEEKK